MTNAANQPIAIIGMSCRLPGANDPDTFWRLLREGVDAITDVPDGRWPDSDDGEYRRGGFVDGVELFDAAFFGISPTEAAAMDPQQRIALELAWEALEHARLAPDSLRGSATGVYVGAIGADYAALQPLSAHAYTGAHRAIIANRVSYVLGLHGPSLTLDTGQSSSLVAVHLACESLRRGESTVAIAGGVNLNLLGETTERIGAFGALSADGRCRTFDADADGYVRGEGGAFVVLKPLGAAVADGDVVHCVIRGGAVNNDGGGDTLTAPSRAAQTEVITAACASAGVRPTDLHYVELHGTGTPVGDPVEAAALGAALANPGETPLLVGSVKTNIGHLEGAAGIAGLLKVALAIRHGELPASLHFSTPNPDIPLAELGLRVVASTSFWPRPGHPLLAGVSSFGMGGTNCHLVVGEAPPSQPPTRIGAPYSDAPWVLSAASSTALRAQAGRLHELMRRTPVEPADLALSLADTRARLAHRAVVLGDRRTDKVTALAALVGGTPDPQVVTGAATGGRCVFTFPGQGSQWPEMAAELLATDEVFAEHLRACADALAPFVDYALLDVLTGAPGAPGLDRVDVVQPALWAVMVSLAGLWRAHGVTPDVVIGHSQGEIAAATVVGALSLEDGARVVALRSKAIRRIAGAGGMLSVAAPLAVARAAAEANGVTVAAVNGPASVVLSGPVAALTELRDTLVADGYRCRLVPVDYASHSSDVDAVRDEVLAALAPIRPRRCDTEFVSTLTGEPVNTATLDAEYWFASLRRPVRFADAVRGALAADCGLFVECSPHPVLVSAVEETADEAERDVAVVGTLRRDHGDGQRFERSLAEAFTHGAPVNWTQRCAHPAAQVVDLPTYAFQRQRYWAGELPARRVAAIHIGQSEQDAVALPVMRSRRELLDLVLTITADVLGHADHTEIAPGRTFKDLGIDSATAVDLRNRLRAATGTRLPAGLTFDHPTPDRLADFLHRGAAMSTAPSTTPTAVVTQHDPIAIVGMGCRYPGGVTSPEELWRLVTDGTDAISGFPTDRGWDIDTLFADGPNRSGTSDTRHGGFLDDADRFDARLFGISPREAAAMDPQQRVLLQVAWEALERAGVDHAGLRGSATGVFLGAMAPDYGPRLHQPVVSAEGHLLTGTALSVVSGRIAYTLGLSGPAMTVDTACSSSLVALHLAVQALRRGECSLALAGGATVMATPGMFVEFSRQSGLAPDGRCKAFADDADGTGWAEGAGVLVLERLSDARRNGHPVLALVRGAAVNSDGRSNGLTAPNGPAQEAVIRAALADAGLSTADVSAIEAHGTGTPLGDPIEATALLATYGARSTGEPAWLGSVKSNIGHTQAAAGVAGVIKMVQALRHRTLPRTLHATEPSRHIDWDSGAVRLLTEPVTLSVDGPARAAVSSFGISGTNSHVIIEHTPESIVDSAVSWPIAWPLSARTTSTLRTQAGRLADFAGTATDSDLAVTATMLTRRARLDVRAVIVAGDRDELVAALRALEQDLPHPSAIAERTVGQDVRPVFVFPGQGSQWAGMAVELFDTNEVFAARLAECDTALAPHTGWSLLDVLRGTNDAPELAGSDVVQPALFAVMVALAAMWQHAGVQPAAVLGHSQGEIAAATVAGVLSLSDAAAMVVKRAKLLMELTGLGGMVSVPLTADEARARIEPWIDRLWLAIESSPVSSVVAGDADALAEFVEACAEGPRPLRTGRVAIDYASHTPHTERLRDRLLAAIDTLTPNPATTSICSGTAGGMIDAAELTPEYWYRNLRHPVLFERAVRTANDSGNTLFIEVSAHPVLTGAVRETVAHTGGRSAAIGTLRRGEGGRRQFLTAAAQAFTLGVDLDWSALVPSTAIHPVDVPTYPFESERHWLDVAPALGGGMVEAGHPLLGAVVALATDDGLVITGRLSRRNMPWLTDHAVGADVLLPGTAFVELATRAAQLSGRTEVADLTLRAPLALPAEGAVTLQLAVAGDGTLTVHSRLESDVDDAGWTRHATGRLTDAPLTGEQLAGWPPDALELDLTDAYEQLAENGYRYGPAFRGLRRLWQGTGERFAEVVLPDAVRGDAARYAVHPALLDAALHPIVLAAGGELLLPFSWTGVRIAASGTDTLRVRITELGDGRVSITGYDEAGRWCLTVDELALLPVTAGPARAAAVQVIDWIAPTGTEGTVLDGQLWPVVDGVGDPDTAAEVRTGLERAGASAPHYYDLSSLADMSTGEQPPAVVVPVLPAVCAAELPYAAHDVLYPVLDLVQGWLGDDRFGDSRLVLLTRNAVTGADVNGMAGGPVWGLVRSAESENPGRFALVDIDGTETTDVPWAAIAAALATGETQLAVRDGELLVPRLARRRPTEATESGWTDGTVLITGGTGGLGARLAEHLVTRHGATRLLLTSRRGPAAPGATELVERLAELGATAEVAACDVADRRALERLITAIPADAPLTGVVHAAGLLDDTTIVGLGAQQLDDVLAAKACGAWYLHELTAELPLARFVLFSSVAGVVGNPGQGNYAAANMFLDRLAALRRAAGLPAVSIAWGLWDNGESSMSGTLSEADIARLLRSGITALDSDRGFAMFDAALAADEPAVVAAAWDNAALRARAERDDLPAVLRGTVSVAARPTTTGAVTTQSTVDAPAGLVARLTGLSESDGRKHVLELVRRHVTVVLGHSDPGAVELDRTFSELGFDSLTAVELRNRLDAEAGIRLPATIAFDHPTVGAIAGYVYTTVAPAPAAPEDLLRDALAQVEAVAPNPDENTRTKLIAILQHSIARLGTGAQPQPEPDERAELDVTSASDEELFALIDNQH